MSESEVDKKNISSEEDEERYIALPAAKSRRRNRVLLKQRRQKFNSKWERIFPWLKADNVDESIGICKVCDKRLVCKKSHLQRHQKTFKHRRVMGFEDVSVDCNDMPEDCAASPLQPEFLECGKQEPVERIDEFEHAIELGSDYNMECELKSIDRIKDTKRPVDTTTKSRSMWKPVKFDRAKLLKRIDRDRQELNEYYRQHRSSSPTSKQMTAAQPRDSFDLFFDSVSASVKTLPPKMAAEVKIRVSQIIAEFELRAICNREASNTTSAMENGSTTLVVTSMAPTQDVIGNQLADDAIVVAAGGGDGVSVVSSVPQILYTFQPNMTE